MSGLDSINGQIANGRSKIFRRIYFKRRLLNSGLYEDDWQECTQDVIKWGSVKKEIDASKVNSFKFSNTSITFSNHSGRYNPCDDDNSMWYGYGDQQRTLVKVVVGFTYEFLENGIWNVSDVPSESLWDYANWDVEGNNWDQEDSGGPVCFTGFISGDIAVKGDNQVSIPMVPLTEAFRLFSARRLTGWSASLTASSFIEMLRDQVDGDGEYIFRPFFQDTTTGFVYETTTANFSNLNTATAADVIDSNVWEIIEKLAVAENKVPYASKDGFFHFTSRDYGNTTPVYHFYGAGGYSSDYGVTIKKVSWFGKRFSKYYSRVQLKYRDTDTATSYVVHESTFRVAGDSSPWTLGERTLEIENLWIPTSTVAETIAEDLFDEYSATRREIEFTTSLVPHLDILDRVQITYDPVPASPNSLWDLYNWGEDTTTAGTNDLIFDAGGGDAIRLNGAEFRLISIDINLDTCECKFIGRE